MRSVAFIIGLGCGAVGLINLNELISTEFTRKVYHDENSDVVTVSGTLTGEIDSQTILVALVATEISSSVGSPVFKR
jgi:hypothetical protein